MSKTHRIIQPRFNEVYSWVNTLKLSTKVCKLQGADGFLDLNLDTDFMLTKWNSLKEGIDVSPINHHKTYIGILCEEIR